MWNLWYVQMKDVYRPKNKSFQLLYNETGLPIQSFLVTEQLCFDKNTPLTGQ